MELTTILAIIGLSGPVVLDLLGHVLPGKYRSVLVKFIQYIRLVQGNKGDLERFKKMDVGYQTMVKRLQSLIVTRQFDKMFIDLQGSVVGSRDFLLLLDKVQWAENMDPNLITEITNTRNQLVQQLDTAMLAMNQVQAIYDRIVGHQELVDDGMVPETPGVERSYAEAAPGGQE